MSERAQGEPLFRRGDDCESGVFIVVRGTAGVYIDGSGTSSRKRLSAVRSGATGGGSVGIGECFGGAEPELVLAGLLRPKSTGECARQRISIEQFLDIECEHP